MVWLLIMYVTYLMMYVSNVWMCKYDMWCFVWLMLDMYLYDVCLFLWLRKYLAHVSWCVWLMQHDMSLMTITDMHVYCMIIWLIMWLMEHVLSYCMIFEDLCDIWKVWTWYEKFSVTYGRCSVWLCMWLMRWWSYIVWSFKIICVTYEICDSPQYDMRCFVWIMVHVNM